jgi:hypothetical protein
MQRVNAQHKSANPRPMDGAQYKAAESGRHEINLWFVVLPGRHGCLSILLPTGFGVFTFLHLRALFGRPTQGDDFLLQSFQSRSDRVPQFRVLLAVTSSQVAAPSDNPHFARRFSNICREGHHLPESVCFFWDQRSSRQLTEDVSSIYS